MHLSRTVFLWLIVAAALVVGFGAVSFGQEQAKPCFRVGVITSLSGPEVYGGNVTKRGYDLWAETVNAQGGLLIGSQRYCIQMFYADDQSEPSTGADAVERMIIRDKVDFILGPYTSGVTMAVAPILEKYRVPMITGSAESPLIWRQKFRYTFGTIPSVDLTGSTPVRTLAELGARTIAIIGVNDPFSRATAEAFRSAATELGMQVVRFDIVPAGTDFTPLVGAIRALNPDVLAVGGHEKEHMEVVKAAKSLNFRPKAFLMHYGITTPDFVANLGRDAEGVMGAAVWTEDLSYPDPLFGDTKGYVQRSRQRWGTTPDYTEAASTAAGQAFAAALQAISATPPLDQRERDALVGALEQIRITTFYGTIDFANEGPWYHDNTGLTPLTIQLRSGKQVIVAPEAFRQQSPLYPLPPW